MRISPFDPLLQESRSVALWGWGRESKATWQVIRQHFPTLPLTLLCLPQEAEQAQALSDAYLQIETQTSAELLSRFTVVIKSPGISPYQPDALAASAQGTKFISGTTLWFAQHPYARTLCVTGTKGKSTTTALLAHLLRANGHSTALAGNIGLPLLELFNPKPEPEFWAIELSSYQTRDVTRSGAHPEIAVVLNLFPEHLDWHGSEQRYIDDKLALITKAAPQHVVLNAADPHLHHLNLPNSQVHWFNSANSWHIHNQQLYKADQWISNTSHWPLPGEHNRTNACAVFTVLEILGIEVAALLPAIQQFHPLPHRLQRLGERNGITYINDSISTTPHASLAALECFNAQPVVLLIGGYDRGLDWADFATHMQQHAPLGIVTMGANGPRIYELLTPLAQQYLFKLSAANDLADAVQQAQNLLAGNGVVLLSPGAPSFGAYRDYTARGLHFAELTGFAEQIHHQIDGLGVK